MDWRIVVATLGMVFASELGDKTWLAILNTSAAIPSRISVLIGAFLGFACATLAAVGLGSGVGLMLPAKVLRMAVGVSFLICGLWFLLR